MGLYEFLKSLARSSSEGLRRNKLPACLSLMALVLTAALALTSNFDERPWYRKTILPGINKVETPFFEVMREAEQEPNELWRARYFLEGHRRAKAALRTIASERPMTETGKKAQRELIRYYELVDEELAIIRTEMSNSESYDYIAEWKKVEAQLLPIRARWEEWLAAAP